MAVLDQMQRIRTSDHVFRVATDKPVRSADVWRLANRLAGISVHGLRSSSAIGLPSARASPAS
jgi:hypothetical protein